MEIHAHKGAPSAFPENTIAGFLFAAEASVNAIELDVVISKDKKVVVSHEPWMHPAICLDAMGKRIIKNRYQTNLYKLKYGQIKTYDCGSKSNSKFKEQKKLVSYKPLLSEVIKKVYDHCQQKGISKPYFNIEIKCRPQEDKLFHPAPKEYVKLVYRVLKNNNLLSSCHVQSFDIRILKELYYINPGLKLGVLVERKGSVANKIKRLGFVPYSFNPRHDLLDKIWMKEIKNLGLKVFAWTVNDLKALKRLEKLGVDGIITDYPYLQEK